MTKFKSYTINKNYLNNFQKYEYGLVLSYLCERYAFSKNKKSLFINHTEQT